MRTLLIVLGIWLLINVLFVVIMLPPGKSRDPYPRKTGALAPVPIDQRGSPFEEQEKFLLSHVIISIAMGAFFSLALPLIEAFDSLKRFLRKPRA